MKTIYREFITHTTAEIDLTTSREICGLVMAEAYCKANKKRNTQKVKDYFTNDCGAFHFVRDILEDIKTDNFETVVSRFVELYPSFHPDWKYALEIGLLIKAERREGGYNNTPHIYNDETATAIREAGINNMKPVIETLLQKHTRNNHVHPIFANFINTF